jgi:hypothetical protein
MLQILRRVLSLILLSGVAILLLNYPLGDVWPSLALGLYAAVLWRHPWLWLPAVLALLPLLNFAPWSGWILVDEFDMLVAVTLAVRLLQPRTHTRELRVFGGATWAIGLLAISFFASALVGLTPLSSFDENALVNYYSSFNSLRVLKGFAWALALLPLLIEEMRQVRLMEHRFVTGMLAGLAGVVAVAVWQRAAFTGLLDFATDYRINATFPEMHTGGGYVETYLAAAIPFAIAWIMLKPSMVRILTGIALFTVATYALSVTFARAGYLAYAGGLFVLGIAACAHWRLNLAWRPRHIAAGLVVMAVGTAVALPALTGNFMQSRLTSVGHDAKTRTQHWADVAGIMNDGWQTALFGMGLGSFPRTYLLTNPHGVVPATFSYVREGENVFLRLGSGLALYLDQRIDVRAGANYTLAVDLRSRTDNAQFRASICEKVELYSFGCNSLDFIVTSRDGNWEHHEITFKADAIAGGWWLLRRPVAISLSTPQSGTIDIDNVRLFGRDQSNLIENGDFARGGNRWYFGTDDHLPWHIKHLWVQILFEQGWLGIAAVGFAVLLSAARLATRAWRGDFFAGTLLAALSAFMLTGLFDSTFDAPRLTTLFFILVFCGIVPITPPPEGRERGI